MSEPAPAGLLLDLDGTLYTGDGPLPGAVEAITALRRRAVPLRFVTNTTRQSRADLLSRLRSYGFSAHERELCTPIQAALVLLGKRDIRVVAPFVAESLLADFRDVDLIGGVSGRVAQVPPEAVVIGDVGDGWSPALLNEAFRYVLEGARFVALQKGRYWAGPSGLELDAGAYVAAIEFATGRSAEVCGKPQRPFFEGALASLGLSSFERSDPARPAMVGDDIWNDVQGAQQAGLRGWLVQTGKFRPDSLRASGVVPDRLLTSIGELAEDG